MKTIILESRRMSLIYTAYPYFEEKLKMKGHNTLDRFSLPTLLYVRQNERLKIKKKI